jgi:hypothetical protein
MAKGRLDRRLRYPGAGQALKERVQLLAVQGKSGVVIYLVFVSPEADLAVISPVFDHMLNSVFLR